MKTARRSRTRRLASLAATAAVGLAVMTGCKSVPSGIRPVHGFEADRYLGEWYEIARLDHFFERGMTHVSASYDRRPDGRISVVNRGFDTRKGRWKDIEGVARFRGAEDVGALSVTFQWPFSGAYNVFELDREGYEWALVCGPSRDYLWILARKPQLSDELRSDLVARIRGQGFAVGELIWVDQDNPPPR
jgi:apolipoprotein D and lipocalin family protein